MRQGELLDRGVVIVLVGAGFRVHDTVRRRIGRGVYFRSCPCAVWGGLRLLGSYPVRLRGLLLMYPPKILRSLCLICKCFYKMVLAKFAIVSCVVLSLGV